MEVGADQRARPGDSGDAADGAPGAALEQQARSGQAKPEELRGEQSAVKQGVDNAAQRLQQEGQKTSLLSGRSQRSVSEAQQKVAQATQPTADARRLASRRRARWVTRRMR